MFLCYIFIQDVIDEPMSTLSAMLDVILPRIKPDPDIKRVSMEDQQSFVSDYTCVTHIYSLPIFIVVVYYFCT